jgi:hypothetical protein
LYVLDAKGTPMKEAAPLTDGDGDGDGGSGYGYRYRYRY